MTERLHKDCRHFYKVDGSIVQGCSITGYVFDGNTPVGQCSKFEPPKAVAEQRIAKLEAEIERQRKLLNDAAIFIEHFGPECCDHCDEQGKPCCADCIKNRLGDYGD